MRVKRGISIPILNQDYLNIPRLAALADEAGFDSVWDYEFYRNPFVMHALNSQVTSNIMLGTGLAAAAGRSPFEMANAAADVDELSGGRLLLGMSTGGEGFAECLNGADIDRPATRMNEYIQVMRMAWRYLREGDAVEYDGEFYRFRSPAINPWGLRPLARPTIPVYLAGLQPAMLRLAGRHANGVLGFLLAPRYIKEQWLPPVEQGAVQAGRALSEIDRAALVLCCVSEDRERAMRLARINVGMYICTPMGELFAGHMGLTEERNAVLEALLTKGPAELATATSDELVKQFAIAGTPDEGREQLAAYEDALTHVILHTPYVPPITGADSEWAFRNTLKYFAA